MMTATRRAALFATVVLTLAPTPTRAALLAYDSFSDNPVGIPLIGTSNSGTGFVDPWHPGGFNASIFANYTIGAGSLTDDGLLTAGNHVTTADETALSGLTRDLSTPIGTPGTTVYLSVLLRPEGVLDQGVDNGFFGLYLNASTPNFQDLFLGKPGIQNNGVDQYDLEDRGSTNQHFTNATPVVGQTDLLVLRMDFATSGPDKFTLYVDPTLGAPEPSTGTVKQDSNLGIVNSLTLYSTGAYSVDEIRIGTTYADVVPAAVPEPASLVMASTAALTGLGWWWRRRKRSPLV